MNVIQCPFVKFHVHDDNGYPASGWRLYTFKAGTDEPLTAYKDASGTVEYGAYALLNSRGEPDGDGFFLAEGMAYKLILKRPDGSTAWSQPYVLPSSTGGGAPGASVIAARSVLGNMSASHADAVAVPVADVIANEPNSVPSTKAVFEAVQSVESEMVHDHGEQAIDGSLAVSGALSAGSLTVNGEAIDDRYVRKAGHAGLSLVGRSEGGVGVVSDVPMVETLTSESNRASIPNAGAVLDAEGNPQPCTLCGAKQGEECKRDTAFMPRHSREAIHALFKADINNPQKLVRDYRDVAFLLWALGLLDSDKLVGPTPTNVAEGSRPEGDDPISTGPQIVWVELPQNVSRESFEVFVNAAMRMVAESADHTPHD